MLFSGNVAIFAAVYYVISFQVGSVTNQIRIAKLYFSYIFFFFSILLRWSTHFGCDTLSRWRSATQRDRKHRRIFRAICQNPMACAFNRMSWHAKELIATTVKQFTAIRTHQSKLDIVRQQQQQKTLFSFIDRRPLFAQRMRCFFFVNWIIARYRHVRALDIHHGWIMPLNR